MALCELKIFSPALGKQTAATVILPEAGFQGPFAVFYLLHGLSDDHTIWQRRTSIERYVAEYPLIVVMPDGGRSFYTDAKEGDAYETAIVRDLMGRIETLFQARTDRGGRCIGGLSMGGYGAIKLALKYPERFCSATSHSGGLLFGSQPPRRDANPSFQAEMRRIFGERPQGGPEDLFPLAAGLDPKRRPALRIDCGTEDFLIERNREFHAHLDRIGYPHEYAEFPGQHEWGYWDLHVQEAIAFHVRHLGLTKREPGSFDVSRKQ
jgi:S-formylglutathione hydrolase FrmB